MAAVRDVLADGKLANLDEVDILDDELRCLFEKHDYKLVESVNALSIGGFFDRFCPVELQEDFLQKVGQRNLVVGHAPLEMTGAEEIRRKTTILDFCLDLVEETSKADYNRSSKKWSRVKKRKEMLLPEMKYLVFWASPLGKSKVGGGEKTGFASFMITYEDGHEVLYIYEIHIIPSHQRFGCGGALMDVVEAIGTEVGVEKAMLTVFKSNQRAVNWYKKRGYVEDEYSPGPKQFRDGTSKEPTYLILSKPLKDPDNVDETGVASRKARIQDLVRRNTQRTVDTQHSTSTRRDKKGKFPRSEG